MTTNTLCTCMCRTQKTLGALTTVDTLLAHVQKECSVNMCTRDRLMLLLGYLDYIGTVLYFADVPALQDIVVLDTQWFGKHVIGRVLAPSKDALQDGTPLVNPENGRVEYNKFEDAMTRSTAKRKFTGIPHKYIAKVVCILEEMQVCSRVKGACAGPSAEHRSEWLVFPSMLPPGKQSIPSDLWKAPRSDNQPLALGMRLKFDHACYVIPTGYFPKLQVSI